ncbi:non-heme iron oxygenase ferredoxin subunit [Demequina capsici]|uniref:Non-heme iron oxygenase ferredoxin subunit n=1 Tax=Demequina capsici TaxID=3075620 RepID=A0AA96F5N5_9MICO|nr:MULTISPECIES: non-heme iron oxygenase ferredoxin subunit [unclassified Demequina]WNM23237.1 non-heme iron oxygenase ferredoxin subunit [Demequina sp. OYTSA14]WNM26116.1 non-heme iron oxygenase ferredoxin subunit [Demequina sp. PMTSA13]
MSEQVACNVTDVKPGTALLAELTLADGSEQPFAIVRAEDGEFYAIDDTCTHGQVSLSEGDVEGCEIECWAHGGRFDFRTGAATELPALSPVKAYPVRVDGELVLVDIDNPKTPQAS